jgi:hypothetical protein
VSETSRGRRLLPVRPVEVGREFRAQVAHAFQSKPAGDSDDPATYREREILVYEHTSIINRTKGDLVPLGIRVTFSPTISTLDVILAASPHRLH